MRIRTSPRAQKLLVGAIKTGEDVEVKRIIGAANRARGLRIAGNTVGAGLDAFGVYMAYCDWQANDKRIAETNNPQLKALYANANAIYMAEAGTSALGLVIGGVAVYSAWASGAGVITALGAPFGAVMAPIGLAVMAARATYEGLEKSAEYHTMTERDMIGHGVVFG